MPSPTIERPVRRWTPTRAVILVVVLALVAMWAYVLYLAIGPGRQAPPDRLDDPRFAVAAQTRCRQALDRVAALPPADEAHDADERADVVARANEELAAMVDDLEAMTPAGEDGDMVKDWLSDWRTYLGDREDYAVALRDDPAAQLFVSVRDNEQVTEYLDAFAADNKMTACATPIDV